MPRVADRFAAEPFIEFLDGIAILGTAILQQQAAITVVHRR
jgi:hypothetical protein